MKKFTLYFAFSFLLSVHSSFGLVPEDYTATHRKGVTSGYYLGFTSLADEMRQLTHSSSTTESDGFLKSLYVDFHYANQEFNKGFYDDSSAVNKHDIEHTIYGLTLGFGLGDNPNLDVRIPLSITDFNVGNIDDSGMITGIELFPNYRINQYVAWGVNIAHLNSSSDFPMFDESMTSVSFETMLESSEAYGMNWSGRLSIGRYFPSNDINDESLWLFKGRKD